MKSGHAMDAKCHYIVAKNVRLRTGKSYRVDEDRLAIEQSTSSEALEMPFLTSIHIIQGVPQKGLYWIQEGMSGVKFIA